MEGKSLHAAKLQIQAEDLAAQPLGPNAGRPEHGAANLADARAYHERLAARGERDES